MGTGFPSGDKYVQVLDSDYGFTVLCMYLIPLNCTILNDWKVKFLMVYLLEYIIYVPVAEYLVIRDIYLIFLYISQTWNLYLKT